MTAAQPSGRLAYDDPSSPAEMGSDALAALTALGWVASPGYVPREATKRGVAPERLIFGARVGSEEHLARHQLAGVLFGHPPVNAHTTAK